MNLGNAVKLARNSKHMTQKDLSEKSGLSVSYISLVERDMRDPTVSSIVTIANALEIPTLLLVHMAMAESEYEKLTEETHRAINLEWIDYLRPENG